MLIRPKPVEGECLQSYILRLCRSNGWSYNEYKEHVTKHVAPLQSTKIEERTSIIQHLYKSTGHDTVFNLIDVWKLAAGHRFLLDMKRHKICPQCYRHDQVIPAYWYTKRYLVCVKHQSLLIDACPNCNERFSQNSFINSRCENCESSMVDVEPVNVDADRCSQVIYRLFEEGNGLDSHTLTRLRHFESELSVLSSLIDHFSRTSTHKRDGRRRFSIDELYRQQLEYSVLAIKSGALYEKVSSVITDLYREDFYNLGEMIEPIMPFVHDPGCKHIFDTFREFILNCPEQLSELRVGLNWLEKMFGIKKGMLSDFTKKEFAECLRKTQGAPSILALDAGELINAFQSR